MAYTDPADSPSASGPVSTAFLEAWKQAVPTAQATPEPYDALSRIRASGRLVVITSADFPPLEYTKTGPNGGTVYAGSDIELARYLAEGLGVEGLVIRNGDFDTLSHILLEGGADLIIAGMKPTAERKKMFCASASFTFDGKVVNSFLAESSLAATLTEPEDFEGLTVAVQSGSYQEDLIRNKLPGVEMILVTDNASIPELMRSGEADAVLVTGIVATHLLDTIPTLEVTPFSLGNSKPTYAVYAAPGEERLIEEINLLLDQAEAQGVYQQWLDAAR